MKDTGNLQHQFAMVKSTKERVQKDIGSNNPFYEGAASMAVLLCADAPPSALKKVLAASTILCASSDHQQAIHDSKAIHNIVLKV